MKFNFRLTIISEDLNETQNGTAILFGDKFYYNTEEKKLFQMANLYGPTYRKITNAI